MVCQHLDRTHYNYGTEHLKFKIGSLSDLITTYTSSYLINHTSNLHLTDDQGFINTFNIQVNANTVLP